MSKAWTFTAGAIAMMAALVAIASVAIGRDGRETVVFIASAMLYGISTAGDVAECSQIVREFLRQHDLPKSSKSVPGKAPVFCNAGARGYIFTTPPTVVIYGTVDRTRQDQYLVALDSIRRGAGAKKLRVMFFEQENWIEWKSKETGAYGGDRGPERLLRNETLSRLRGVCVA